jgi:hypothetical protein
MWRGPDPAIVLALASGKSALRNLCAAVAGVRPAACDVAGMLDGMTAAFSSGPLRDRDTLATDLLATALLVEGIHGCVWARRGLAHMRRQRRLADLVWPRAEMARRPDRAAESEPESLPLPA